MRWLLAPGFACTSMLWRHFEEHCPDVEGCPVVWPEGLTTVSSAADHLLARIEATDPDVVVGHSMGGVLALALAVEGRHDRPMIIVDAFLNFPPPFFRNFVHENEALEAEVKAMLEPEKARRTALQAALQAWEDPPDWIQACHATGAAFIYGGRGAPDDATVIDHLGWPPGSAAGVPLAVLPRTSHMMMLERPAAFYARVRRLVAQLVAPR